MKELFKSLIVDFLFPKEALVLELEALSIDALLHSLPEAKKLDDKNILALFDYNHPKVKAIILEIKYKGNTVLAEKLAAILYDVLRHELAEKIMFESVQWKNNLPILLVPVPASEERRYKRGWNQAELIAERIAKLDTEKFFKYSPYILVKSRHTESQTKTTSRNERLKNLTGSMEVQDASAATGKCVILVDDVVTTGSTFSEACRALSIASAKKILCIAVAH